MRKATDKFKQIYETRLGQDVIETLFGAGMSAGYQGLFTDMTPEEILVATGVGIGAAAVGRPVIGRAGRAIGTRISKMNPGADRTSQQAINALINNSIISPAAMKAKFAPYADLNPTAQLGEVLGRGYGDNIAQGAVAFVAPGLMPGVDDEQA